MTFLILFVLILLNGLFALSETAIVASRKTRLKHAASKGSKTAKAALRLAQNPNRFLSTIQIGITVIGILSGVFAEATLSKSFQAWIGKLPVLYEWKEEISTTVLVLGLTYFSIVIGELIPKRIALMHPEAVAMAVALPMRFLSRVTKPFVKALGWSTDGLLLLMGIRPPAETGITTEELQVLLKEGTEAGIFEKAEQDIFTNVFRLGERRASALMTPRADIVWLGFDEDDETIREKLKSQPHAFFPVAHQNLDHVVGIISAKNILARVLANEPIALEEMMHRPLIVPESVTVLQMLESFRESPAEMALIADEYGSILGVVTQNDVLESIVGELPDDKNDIESQPVQREDGSWLLNGNMPADAMRDLLDLPELPHHNNYDTAAGFVIMQLQRIPATGDYFIWEKTKFEVVDLDGRRIDKILVMPELILSLPDE